MSNVISIVTECMDLYSIALCQNKIDLIDSITLRNISDFNLKNLELEVTSSPEFFADFSARIGEISSGRYIRLSKIDLSVYTTALSYLSSSSSSTVTIRIKSQGEVLAEKNEQILLLPYDTIPSVSLYPELVSPFVTPMQPEVKKIAENLHKYINSPIVPLNMDMWKNVNRDTAYEIISSVYFAIKDLRITYNISNLMIESKHCKVKLPESLLSYKNGNSLEISLLFASICEYIGFDPIIIFNSGKVFTGVFFTNSTFSSPIVDDARPFSTLTDGISYDFCIIDPTTLFGGTNISFEDSAKMASKTITDTENSIIVDIKECRKAGILPLQNRIVKDGNIIFENATANIHNNEIHLANNFKSLSTQVKSGLLNDGYKKTLINLDKNDITFLIGTAKSIATKFLFNSRVVLRSFLFDGVISGDTDDIFGVLLKLNENIDVSDVSDTVSTLYEKMEFDKKLVKLIDIERSQKSLYLAVGLVVGSIYGKKISSPLYLVPATLTYDNKSFYLSVSKSSGVLNAALFDYLKEYTDSPNSFNIGEYDCLDDYDTAVEKIKDGILSSVGLEVLNISMLTKLPYDNYLVSSVANAEYFEKSNLIRCLTQKKAITNIPYMAVENDSLQPNFFEMPLLLDSSQANAYNCACCNDVTVISGPNGSGKTRVAASIAYTALQKGESVIYASCSESNIDKFKSYADECGISNFLFTVSKNNLKKNSFDLSHSFTKNDGTDNLKDDIIKTHSYLSNYYSAIHKVREIGFSLYESISQYERYKTFPYTVNFTNSEVKHLSRENVVHWFDVVSNLAKAGADCHEPYNNPLTYIRCRDFSYDLKSNAVVCLTEYKNTLSEFISMQSKLADFLGIETPIIKESQSVALIKFVKNIKENIEYIFPRAYTRADVETEFINVETFLDASRDFFQTKVFLDGNFSSDVLQIDADGLLNEWRAASLKFAITRNGAQNSVKNKLKVFAHDPKIVTSNNIVELFSKISDYKSSLSKMAEISTLIRQIFGIDLENEIAKNNEKVFEQIRKSLDETRAYSNLIREIYDSEKKPETVFVHNAEQFLNREKFICDINVYFEKYLNLSSKLKKAENDLVEILNLDLDEAKNDNYKIWYYFAEKFVDRMIDNIDLLKHWCRWNKEKEKAVSAGLYGVVNLYTSEQMTYNDIKNAFLKGFFKAVSEYIMSCESDINNFSKEKFENFQNQLIKNSENLRKLSSERFVFDKTDEIKARLLTEVSCDCDEALMQLKRDFEYNDKYYNISPNSQKLLKIVKPCFISQKTSLLSQLRYCNDFDTLIVDTVEDFGREELLVMLPLARRVVLLAENNTDNTIERECINLGSPHVKLSWIYSYNFTTFLVNKLFYPESTSFIFTDNGKKGVTVVHQKGTYDKKNTRTNFIEASAAVDELMKKLDAFPNSSIAVISVTEEQASLIELLFTKRLQALDGERKKAFFSRREHFLISSLEKASFTPCDTVIFSTTFSLEEKSRYNETISKTIPEFSSEKFRRNFVNSLLCAEKEFIIVTSLSREILNRFKTVIPNYSLFKNIVLHLCDDSDEFFVKEMNKVPRIENSVIRQVINHIESLGYQADIDIGTNSCRIDVAVKNKFGDGYLFGIIFDETAYLYGGDLISRASIVKNLEQNLGWKILRIYMIEWFENSPKQLDLITDMLKEGEMQTPIISFDVF